MACRERQVQQAFDDFVQSVARRVRWIHEWEKSLFQPADPAGRQSGLARAVNIPSVGSHESQLLRSDAHDFRRVQIDFPRRFPAADFVNRNNTLDQPVEPGALKQLVGGVGAPIRQGDDGHAIVAEHLESRSDIRVNGKFTQTCQSPVQRRRRGGEAEFCKQHLQRAPGHFGKWFV